MWSNVFLVLWRIVATLLSMRQRHHHHHHPISRCFLCVHNPGTDESTTLCRKKACFCSQCLEQPNEISPSSGEFDDGLETITSSSCFPAGSKSRRRAIKLVTKRCVNCLMGYSADCLALCCCPLSIPHFLFVTLPVLLYRRICKLRTKAKSVSAYQRLGINPDELRKPKDSLLKEDEIPFTGFGGEYWKENFES